MNNRRRMWVSNAAMKEKLKEMGFSDIWMFPHTRFSLDVWGLWDGVCKKYSTDEKFTVHWLQFKTGYCGNELKDRMAQFCKESRQKAILLECIKTKVKYANKKGSYEKQDIKVTFFGE